MQWGGCLPSIPSLIFWAFDLLTVVGSDKGELFLVNHTQIHPWNDYCQIIFLFCYKR